MTTNPEKNAGIPVGKDVFATHIESHTLCKFLVMTFFTRSRVFLAHPCKAPKIKKRRIIAEFGYNKNQGEVGLSEGFSLLALAVPLLINKQRDTERKGL